MPTREQGKPNDDTVDFKIATLDDFLEADARAGMPASGGDEAKFRRWAYLATAAAGIFAVLLAVTLVTGGGDEGEGGGEQRSTKDYGSLTIHVVKVSELASDIEVDHLVSVLNSAGTVVSGVPVANITRAERPGVLTKVEVALTPEQLNAVIAAAPPLQVVGGEVSTPPATTARKKPAAETPLKKVAPPQQQPAPKG